MGKLDGKTALVTGSTDGVGRYVAEALAARGCRVLVHGRDAGRGQAVISDIVAEGGSAEFLRADLASLAEVGELADAVASAAPRLDILVNNAGIGTGGAGAGRDESRDGSELRFAVNYLAGYLLARLLLPQLIAAAPARIVNVASLGQYPIDFDDVMLTRDYDAVRAYRQSKLAQILFTFELAGRLSGKGVSVNCLHPATFMNTTMVRQAGVAPLNTVADGGEAVMTLAVAPDFDDRSGLFFDGLKESRANDQAYDEAARKRLWSLSADLCGFPEDLRA